MTNQVSTAASTAIERDRRDEAAVARHSTDVSAGQPERLRGCERPAVGLAGRQQRARAAAPSGRP